MYVDTLRAPNAGAASVADVVELRADGWAREGPLQLGVVSAPETAIIAAPVSDDAGIGLLIAALLLLGILS
jgi:hypothetical protein